jgi:REP element-mobilizing transposase RayT
VTDEPLAYFITWTVYGSHLQGAETGWMKRGRGPEVAQPLLNAWHSERLNHLVELLDDQSRHCVVGAVTEICQFRNWKCWIANARTNHVHVVVTAIGFSGDTVRDQLKAKCTRELRATQPRFRDRPVWSRGGDWKFINTEDDLESRIAYAGEAQDRKSGRGS